MQIFTNPLRKPITLKTNEGVVQIITISIAESFAHIPNFNIFAFT